MSSLGKSDQMTMVVEVKGEVEGDPRESHKKSRRNDKENIF